MNSSQKPKAKSQKPKALALHDPNLNTTQIEKERKTP
jgi:hypothetical protein